MDAARQGGNPPPSMGALHRRPRPVTSRYEHRTWRNPDGDLVAECRIVRLRDGTIMDQSARNRSLSRPRKPFTEEFHQLYLGNARCTERRALTMKKILTPALRYLS